jgi:hypothetical protein
MRFSIAAAIATLSATVLAQGNLANIPTCAVCTPLLLERDIGSNIDSKTASATPNWVIVLAFWTLPASAKAQPSPKFPAVLWPPAAKLISKVSPHNSYITSRLTRTSATITFATTLCQGAGVSLNTTPNCGSNSSSSASASSSAASAASAASASSSAALTAVSGTHTASGSATRSASSAAASGSAAATAATGAGAFQTAGPVLGLGVAVVGMLAAL